MACTDCKKKTTRTSTKVTRTSSSKFAFRANIGMVETSFGSGEFITNETMTDELAITFLKVNPSRISMFETYPKNWMQLLSNDDKTDEGQSKSK